MDLKKRLKKGMVICAEGYLFELERRGYLKAGAFVPEVVLDYPKAVEELHREFLRAGSDIIEAFTYYAHRDKLRIIGRENDLEKLNRNALRIAKKVAREGNALLAGNICNTWVYDHNNHDKTKRKVQKMFDEQVRWAKEEGADFIIAETMSHLGEAQIALDVIRSYDLDAVVTFATNFEKTWDNYQFDEACKVCEDEGALVVGLNCTRGPRTLLPILKKVRKKVKGYVGALPVPFRTTVRHPTMQSLKLHDSTLAFPTNLDPFLLTRDEMGDFAREAQKMDIRYIGICCGAGPHHIRSMAEAIGRKVPASRYSPDMSEHGMLGSKKVVRKYNSRLKKRWNTGYASDKKR